MLIVQKYGGATLADSEKIKSVAKRISELKKNNTQVVAVVSAMGQTTNQLIDLAHQVAKAPNLRELDMLLSVGERMSMSLVSIALNDLGHEAISFTGSQAGILTNESHLNATIKDVKAHRVQEAIEQNKIVILAGFQGVSPVTKEITTLGRGGSDTSAVAMAAYLKAERCEILKDVSSIFTADPKLVKGAKKIAKLNYDQLLEMTYWGAKVLHYRSVELAKIKKVKLYVGPADNQNSEGTTISEGHMFESSQPLAVNSHARVLQIEINQGSMSEAIQQFNKILTKNNIGMPQILCGTQKSNSTQIFITAPNEILELIANTPDFNIIEKALSSVSITCTGSSLNETLIQATEKLNSIKISPQYFMQSAMSLNFIISNTEKDKAIQTLHELIN